MNPLAPRSSRESAQRLADHVRGWAEAGRVIGAELLVIEDGEVLVHEASGWSDRERRVPLARDSLYRVRSMTKPLVATAILMLVEAGELGLDDRVADHLPAWDNPRSGAIRLRQLLWHVGGFEQNAWPERLGSYPSLRAAVDAMGIHGPQHPPGSVYLYSDVDGATLGAIVAARTGRPVDAILREWITAPLGMDEARLEFDPAAPWAERVNPTYRWVDGQGFERYWDPSRPASVPFFRAAGGLLCSARDYARFLGHWLALARGEQPTPKLISPASARAALEPGPFGRYGMFWDLPTTARAGAAPWAFGHVGTDGTAVLAVPERRLLALYFTQSRLRNLMFSFSMRAGDVFGLPGPMPKYSQLASQSPRELTSLDPRARRAIVGTYEFGGPHRRLEFFEVPWGEGAVIQTWLRGEEVQLVPLVSPPGERRFALGWHREGGGVELRCDELAELVFFPGAGEAQYMEIQVDGVAQVSGSRLHTC